MLIELEMVLLDWFSGREVLVVESQCFKAVEGLFIFIMLD